MTRHARGHETSKAREGPGEAYPECGAFAACPTPLPQMRYLRRHGAMRLRTDPSWPSPGLDPGIVQAIDWRQTVMAGLVVPCAGHPRCGARMSGGWVYIRANRSALSGR